MKVPSTTVEFLDALKTRKGFTSDYQLWKALEWQQGTVSAYRRGKSTMSDAYAIRMADELGLSRGYVLACMAAERERNDQVAKVWRELAHKLKGAAAIILIALSAGALHSNTATAGVFAQAAGHFVRTVYILSNRARRFLKELLERVPTFALAVLP